MSFSLSDLNSGIKFKTLNSFAFIVIEVPNPDFLAKVNVLFAFGNRLYSELKTLLFFGIFGSVLSISVG